MQLRISLASKTILSLPMEQLAPTASAPASTNLFILSSTLFPISVTKPVGFCSKVRVANIGKDETD